MSAGAPNRKAFEALLNTWNPADRLTLVDHLGWTDDSFKTFMMSDKLALGDDKVIMQNPAITSANGSCGCSGTLLEWRENVSKKCIDNPLLIRAVSHAFAGALLAPLDLEGGGLHLRGESSSGKTTLLKVALSVWGRPDQSNWATTSNALEATLAAANSTLLAIDELGSVSGKAAYDAVYMMGNGAGKARARSDGSAAEIARWRTSVLSTGEITLQEKMAEDGRVKQNGQEVRLLDISADTRPFSSFDYLHGSADAGAFADSLRDVSLTFHGTAGRAFVQKLLKQEDLFERAKRPSVKIQGSLLANKRDSGGVVKRAAMRFAIVATAGEIATNLGLTGWSKGAALAAAKVIFQDWFEGREDSVSVQISPEQFQVAILRIVEFERRSAEQIHDLAGPKVGTPVAYRDEEHLFLPTTTWESLHGDHNPAGLPRMFKAAGMMTAGEDKNLQRKLPRVFGANGSRGYALKLCELQKRSEQ